MTAVSEVVKPIGLFLTFGDKPGINYQSLFMFRRDHVDDRRPVEGDKVKISGVPTGKSSLVIRTVTAEIPKRDMAWQHQEQSQEMHNKLLLRFLGLA